MTLRFDVHVHSARTVAGSLPAEHLIRRAEEAGLDGIVLTELGERWSERELVNLRLRTETPLIVLSAEYLIVEDVSLLAYGFWGRLPPLDSLETAVGRIRAEGGTPVVAYPFDDGSPSLERLREIGVLGLELYSANGELPSDEQVAEVERLGFATVAGSGFRGGDGISVGDCHTLVDADVRSAQDLAVAIRTGRTRAVFGPPSSAAPGVRPGSRGDERRFRFGASPGRLS